MIVSLELSGLGCTVAGRTQILFFQRTKLASSLMVEEIQALFGGCCVVLEQNSGKDKDLRKESAQMWTKRTCRRGEPDTKATTASAVFEVQRPEKASKTPEVVDVVDDRKQQDLENCLQDLANAIRSEDFERAKQLKAKRDQLCSLALAKTHAPPVINAEEKKIYQMTKEERISQMLGRFTITPELQKAQAKYHNRVKQLAQYEKRVEKDSKDFEDGFTVGDSCPKVLV